MHQWELVSNPGWARQRPQGLKQSDCHDRSHFVTVQCRCGEQMHMHESAVQDVPADQGIASRCQRCRRLLKFPPRYFAGAFTAMREQGWII